MSSKSSDKVKAILQGRLKELALATVGTESIPDLADYLDMRKQTLYGWASQGRIPIKSVKSKIPDVNPYFLKNGEGAPLLSQKAKRAIGTVDRARSIAAEDINDEPTRDNLIQSLELAERLVQRSLRIARKLNLHHDN